MSHVAHISNGWIMSHIFYMDESCHTYTICVSHVTHENIFSWLSTANQTSYKRVMSHIYQMDESCLTYTIWTSRVTRTPYWWIASHVRHMDESRHTAAPMNHVKYLRASPAEMPFQNWYTANTNHFHLTDSVRWTSTRQLYWVINPVPHNLVRRIRFWRIKSLEQDFKHCAER